MVNKPPKLLSDLGGLFPVECVLQSSLFPNIYRLSFFQESMYGFREIR